MARAAAPGDPATAADTLERLAGVAFAPHLLGRGVVAGASWSAEEALPGRRPRALTWDLVRQVASACATLPRCAAPPSAPVDDLLGAAARLPWLAGDLRRLADLLRPRLDGIPAIERHGDLWAGNLLVDGGALCGIVDWDAAHRPAFRAATSSSWWGPTCGGVPAARWGARCSSAPGARARSLPRPPDTGGRSASRPPRALLDTAGVAWWATEIHGTLLALPTAGGRPALGH